MRLIDADELNEFMYHEAFETDSEMQKWDSGCWIRYKMFENNLAKCKPVDAEPVVHGHWVRIPQYDSFGDNGQCSICKNIYTSSVWGTRYCPTCGAKMDKEEE